MPIKLDIKSLRLKLEMSQTALGKATGITREKIGKWETGVASPKTEDHEKLVNYFTMRGLLVPQPMPDEKINDYKDDIIKLYKQLLDVHSIFALDIKIKTSFL